MTDTAQQHQTSAIPFRSGDRGGALRFPGIEGFYGLKAGGTLGRYTADGGFLEEPELSGALGGHIAALLRQYRAGEIDRLALGLVTPSTPDQPWGTACMVYSDVALHEVFRTGADSSSPLTAFQKRTKVKSVYQGMELLLETTRLSQSGEPRFCPVLIEPEVDSDTLCRRYGTENVRADRSLEVLDLMAALPDDRRHSGLAKMVREMAQAGIVPELRHAPDLILVENPNVWSGGESASSDGLGGDTPWQDEPEDRDTCFNDGDPVTYWLLAWFTPFNDLTDAQRQFLSRGHTVTRKRAGSTLIQRGSRDDVSICLIEGTLELEAFDGKTITVVGGTRRAHLPISRLRPHAYTIRAVTDVTVILLSQDMVREVNRVASTYRLRPVTEVFGRAVEQ